MTQETEMSTFISLSVNKETGDPETDSDEEEVVNKSLVLPTIAITEPAVETSITRLSSRDHVFPRRHCNCTKCQLSKQQESAEKEQMIVVLRQQLKEQDDTLQEM